MPEKTCTDKRRRDQGADQKMREDNAEETLNGLVDSEAARYERTEQRQSCRCGHYSRNLTPPPAM